MLHAKGDAHVTIQAELEAVKSEEGEVPQAVSSVGPTEEETKAAVTAGKNLLKKESRQKAQGNYANSTASNNQPSSIGNGDRCCHAIEGKS